MDAQDNSKRAQAIKSPASAIARCWLSSTRATVSAPGWAWTMTTRGLAGSEDMADEGHQDRQAVPVRIVVQHRTVVRLKDGH